MKLIVIGDIHGRENWKDLIDKSAVNVFVGDYFDPYDDYSFNELKQNFLDIMRFKIQYPENVVLLYGNHDYHYIHTLHGESSRYDAYNAPLIRDLLEANKHLFYGITYAPDEKHIISHAGITLDWVQLYLPAVNENTTLKKLEMLINNLWEVNPEAFSFANNCAFYDFYGTTPTQSPIWIRPETLKLHALNIDNDWVQIVGHTQFKDIFEDGLKTKNLIFVDVLGRTTKAYKKII